MHRIKRPLGYSNSHSSTRVKPNFRQRAFDGKVVFTLWLNPHGVLVKEVALLLPTRSHAKLLLLTFIVAFCKPWMPQREGPGKHIILRERAVPESVAPSSGCHTPTGDTTVGSDCDSDRQTPSDRQDSHTPSTAPRASEPADQPRKRRSGSGQPSTPFAVPPSVNTQSFRCAERAAALGSTRERH